MKTTLPNNRAQEVINALTVFTVIFYLIGLAGSLETYRIGVSTFLVKCVITVIVAVVVFTALTYVNHLIKNHLESKCK